MKRGRIVAIAAAAVSVAVSGSAMAGTIAYSYDTLGRLVQVSYPNGAVIQYSYDQSGNRLTYVVTGSPNSPPTGTNPIGQN